MKLFSNVRAYRYDAELGRFVRHRSVLVDGKRIAALDEEPVGVGCERVDLDGATLVPAFADCHIHLADTGYFIGGRTLERVRSYGEFERAIARLPRDGEIVYAGQYDDSQWNDGRHADAAPIERVHGDARALVVRIDGHSSIVNARTLAWLDLPAGIAGIERDECGAPTGRLYLDANWEAQSRFLRAFPTALLAAGEERAIDLALANGTVHLHAQILEADRDAACVVMDRHRVLRAKMHPKVCFADATFAVEHGLPYIGGDVFLDGSLGSCTAAVFEPYVGTQARGALRFSDDELLGYFAEAEALGIGAGVHAIGDEAIEQCVRVWERVLGGKPSPRGSRHFIEHFELATQAQIEACARMGIYLSMQPQFDAIWGADGGMYDERLGTQRKRTMNAFGRIVRAGGKLCGGDDSPVCPLDTIAAMRAVTDHNEPGERLDVHQALAMYTVTAAEMGYAENETGNVTPGLCADFAVLDRDPIEQGSFASCRVIQTWIDGERAY